VDVGLSDRHTNWTTVLSVGVGTKGSVFDWATVVLPYYLIKSIANDI